MTARADKGMPIPRVEVCPVDETVRGAGGMGIRAAVTAFREHFGTNEGDGMELWVAKDTYVRYVDAHDFREKGDRWFTFCTYDPTKRQALDSRPYLFANATG